MKRLDESSQKSSGSSESEQEKEQTLEQYNENWRNLLSVHHESARKFRRFMLTWLGKGQDPYSFAFFLALLTQNDLKPFKNIIQSHFPRSVQFTFYCLELIDNAVNNRVLADSRQRIFSQLWQQCLGFEYDDDQHKRLFLKVERSRGGNALKLTDRTLEPLNSYCPHYNLLPSAVSLNNLMMSPRSRKRSQTLNISSFNASLASSAVSVSDDLQPVINIPSESDSSDSSEPDADFEVEAGSEKLLQRDTVNKRRKPAPQRIPQSVVMKQEKREPSGNNADNPQAGKVANSAFADNNKADFINQVKATFEQACKNFQASFNGAFPPASMDLLHKTQQAIPNSNSQRREYQHHILVNIKMPHRRQTFDALNHLLRFNPAQLADIYYLGEVTNGFDQRKVWFSAATHDIAAAQEQQTLPRIASKAAVVMVRDTALAIATQVINSQANQPQDNNLRVIASSAVTVKRPVAPAELPQKHAKEDHDELAALLQQADQQLATARRLAELEQQLAAEEAKQKVVREQFKRHLQEKLQHQQRANEAKAQSLAQRQQQIAQRSDALSALAKTLSPSSR